MRRPFTTASIALVTFSAIQLAENHIGASIAASCMAIATIMLARVLGE